jgi:hypothetical protein
MSDELSKKIRRWLGEQGYPLEMQVAQAFREAGFYPVSSSEYYPDPDEAKEREIDVIAAMRTTIAGVIFQIAYTVECKSSKDSPWVCFCTAGNQDRDLLGVGFAARYATVQGRDLINEIASNADESTNLLFSIPKNHAYGVINALKNGVDLPYRAISASRKGAQALVAFYDRRQANDRTWTVCIAFPLVVVDAPVFNCHMNKTGEIELSQTDFQTVLRTGFDTFYSAVEIVAASKLKAFLKTRAQLLSDFLQNLKPRIPNTLRKLDIDKFSVVKRV